MHVCTKRRLVKNEVIIVHYLYRVIYCQQLFESLANEFTDGTLTSVDLMSFNEVALNIQTTIARENVITAWKGMHWGGLS